MSCDWLDTIVEASQPLLPFSTWFVTPHGLAGPDYQTIDLLGSLSLISRLLLQIQAQTIWSRIITTTFHHVVACTMQPPSISLADWIAVCLKSVRIGLVIHKYATYALTKMPVLQPWVTTHKSTNFTICEGVMSSALKRGRLQGHQVLLYESFEQSVEVVCDMLEEKHVVRIQYNLKYSMWWCSVYKLVIHTPQCKTNTSMRLTSSTFSSLYILSC